ncbi:MAG: hypothetical protein KC435_06405 [Thermomicrobiales bacterium]|nr:hypothetical protein [Thermomicrobiales bacterium]
MTTQRIQRHRLVSIFGLMLLLLSMTPFGVAAQSGLTAADEVAQALDQAWIEVHVSGCDAGSPLDASQLKEPCHENGLAGVNLQITSTNEAIGVNLPNKVTVRENGVGPGIVNTGELPLTEYRIQVDLPTDENAFVFHCELRDSDTVVPVTADPNGAANVFLVTTTGEDNVVCDVYVIPSAQPTIDITYRECTRADLTGDGRTFEDLDGKCATVSTDPPTFNVRDLNTSGEPVSQYQLDAQGELKLTLNAGSYDLFTDLPMDGWGEYLFCEYPGQERYEKEFDPTRGIVTFTDLQDEQITCNWFAVEATDAEAETPTTEPTTIPTTVPTAAPTAVPTQEPTLEPDENTNDGSAIDDDTQISFTQLVCDTDNPVSDTSSLDEFRAKCTEASENVGFSLANTNNVVATTTTDANGQGLFYGMDPATWRVWSDIPLEAATEYYFCDTGDGGYVSQTLSDRGVASFDVAENQQIDCEIYVVPENLRGDITGASVEVHLSACPTGYDGSSYYSDCHDNGVGDMEFTLTGPDGTLTSTTVVENTPGPGIARFTALAAGDYTLAGGPPQDFGSVYLYCSDPANNNAQVETTFADGVGKFTLAENQSITCDWYFIPEDASGNTPTPTVTPEPEKAEIYTTMFACPSSVNVAGSSFSQLDDACTDTVNDVPMKLQRPSGVPVTATTGDDGAGAVRFKELGAGDYVLTPTLPENYVSAALYCDLDGGSVYQKTISNGSTTFKNVDGELISCSWFVIPKAEQQQGPTGSITIREMLCKGDRSSITDWERECTPASSGVSFTVTSVDGSTTQTLTPGSGGVAVFSGLADGYYSVKQSSGQWCRAAATIVNSESQVGVRDGGNTDLFLYQCNKDLGLPNTGSGPTGNDTSLVTTLIMGTMALPLFGFVAWYIRRTNAAAVQVAPVDVRVSNTVRTRTGYRYW